MSYPDYTFYRKTSEGGFCLQELNESAITEILSEYWHQPKRVIRLMKYQGSKVKTREWILWAEEKYEGGN